MSLPTRAISGVLLVAYVAFLAAVLTEYNASVATTVVGRVDAWLTAHGAPGFATAPGRVEALLNAAMFVPLTFLAALAFPRHPWSSWVVYAFVASGAVEVFQGFVLPPRSAQYVDVVANTSGALVGALLAVPFVHLLLHEAARTGAAGTRIDGLEPDGRTPVRARRG